MRKLVFAAAVLLGVTVPAITSADHIAIEDLVVNAADTTPSEARLDYFAVARREAGPLPTTQQIWDFALHLAVFNGEVNLSTAAQLRPGRHLEYLVSARPTGTPPTTTSTTTSSTTTTTVRPTTTTTTSTSTTLPPTSSGFTTVPVGGTLPSEATCASRVQLRTENRPSNAAQNATRGSSPNDLAPRVTGNFVGTTDEIIQWAACKWGLNVDFARAQAALESWWRMDTLGDWGTDPNGCAPGHTINEDPTNHPGQCPQSVGLLQTRWLYTMEAFEDNNATRSTAYQADYVWARWRECFDDQGGFPGDYSWLNTVERGRQYAHGDGLGCMGTWFAGRWYTSDAQGYMDRITDYHTNRIWESSNFPPAQPRGGTPSTTTLQSTTTAPVSTSLVPTTLQPSTSSSTSVPPTQPPSPGMWQQIAPPGPTVDPNFHHTSGNFGFQSIAAAPDGTLFVTADYQGLYRSTDNGATWAKWSTDGDLESGTPWTIQVDPHNPQIMWANAGYGNGGPLRSTDGGRTWTLRPVGSPTQSNDVYSIALDPNVSGHMLVAWHSPWTTGSSGITESTDGGQTWINHPAPSGAWGSGHAVYFLSSSTWLVGTQNDGIWRTTNSGSSWTKVSPTSITHGATGFLTRVGTTLFIAHGQDISRSTDNGATWTSIRQGLNAFASFSAIASDGVNLYTAPSFPSAGNYGSANGPWFVRPISGGTWQPLAGSPNVCYRSVHCNGPRQVVNVGNSVFTSNYNGGVWRLTRGSTPPTTTTTTTVPTTTTSAPTTTVPTTTTSPGTTTTTIAQEPTSGFVEDFNGEPEAMERFRSGVLHRDTFGSQGATNEPTWFADHAFVGSSGDCTPPDQRHTVHYLNEDDSLYVCSSVGGDPAKGHLMTTMGDVTGYSFVYFTPNHVFTDETSVSWDQNITNVGLRQWTEIMIVPLDGPDVACADEPSPVDVPCEFPGFTDDSGHDLDGGYPNNAVVFGSGPLGGELSYTVNNVTTRSAIGGPGLCQLDPEGCNSVAIRRPFSIVDNEDGTLTFSFMDRSWTTPGQFPAGEWKVVFSQHVYTPRKDFHPDDPPTFTWHWDNIVIE